MMIATQMIVVWENLCRFSKCCFVSFIQIMILIDNVENIRKYMGKVYIDLTNRFNKLSPYFNHGGIPIPNTPKVEMNSVSAVWNALCIKSEKLDCSKFRKGLNINEYWNYVEARKNILIPIYRWVLENKVFDIILELRKFVPQTDIVIIDNSINCDIDNTDKPFSFAFLLKSFIEGEKPYNGVIEKVIKDIYVMTGRRDYYISKEEFVYPKIEIYTGQQRVIDFPEA